MCANKAEQRISDSRSAPRILGALVFILAGLGQSPAIAQTFKCTGADGQITFAQVPCSGAGVSEAVKIQTNSIAPLATPEQIEGARSEHEDAAPRQSAKVNIVYDSSDGYSADEKALRERDRLAQEAVNAITGESPSLSAPISRAERIRRIKQNEAFLQSQLAQQEVIYVKYRGPVSLAGFNCAATPESLVRRICYLPSEEYLIVLLDQTYYHYCMVPEPVAEDWSLSPSLGGFYNANVKGRYDCRLGGVPAG